MEVSGKIIKVDKSKAIFVLGCEDACETIPMKYQGELPKSGSEVIVYGKVTKTEIGKYIFEAQKVQVK
ncbi:MAG: hypothetical protein IEMM0008_1756 [bacterium]|nr:MAG: hypothetical protein IEMM0008_1756 [bacterium]